MTMFQVLSYIIRNQQYQLRYTRPSGLFCLMFLISESYLLEGNMGIMLFVQLCLPFWYCIVLNNNFNLFIMFLFYSLLLLILSRPNWLTSHTDIWTACQAKVAGSCVQDNILYVYLPAWCYHFGWNSQHNPGLSTEFDNSR